MNIKIDIYLAVAIIAVVILVLGIFIYFFQHKFFFQPEKLPPDFKFAYDNLKAEEKTVEPEPSAKINYLHFQVDSPKGVVLYLKGNTKSIKGWGKFAIDFTRLGYEVIMMDYRGFGKSTGKRTVEAMKRDSQFIYNIAKKEFSEDKIVVYGRSLGSGFAARLASKNNPRLLILTSPLYSLLRTIHRYLPFMPAKPFLRYNIPTFQYLKNVRCPIKIIHGSDDRLVPLRTAVDLSEINPERTRLYVILGAGHINIHQFEEYHRVMEEIFEEKKIVIDSAKTSLGYSHRK
ncbi:alpha/beta hydrolase [Chryseobacterium salivictor]|uniref:2-hydroxy-6-oxononadienedioate/2-hydroxy-6-oxononatrienedioate hydrolase n=1 Tax=Chryseobacterium salivictor TaxID=2547600 RepID=A0A4P6ZIP9_9FLAO|nr:alpha/beta fold hydrolase [Chryseobacterium salivictor]QBO59482.1 2-hydroxy-6-oxononadienedioate/2-hydroxy-6-oxononatrienedioate hydrolase [Chryseobacterium salivictor]